MGSSVVERKNMSLGSIVEVIKEHMEDQPWDCVCKECGGNIDLDIIIDSGLDMKIKVPICECQDENSED
jgi:hypothetical protein